MDSLKSSRAARTFDFFRKINQVPRCSNNETQISNFLKDLGEELGFETIQDEFLNVYMNVPASKGYEDHDSVAIQAHMDMVCEKEETCNHDFDKDPIDMFIDGDYIKARGTTLGADDAIGIALALDAAVSDDIKHPNLEIIITSTEETGMDGVMGLSADLLKSKKLINIDTEDEGIMIIGCAGGVNAYVELPMQYTNIQGLINKKVVVRGLKGGHSGLTIGSEHLNGLKLLNNVVVRLKSRVEIFIQNFTGGTKHNAIPSKSEVILGIKPEFIDLFNRVFEEEKNAMVDQYLKREPGLEIDLEDGPDYDIYITEDISKKIHSLINLLPHGINTMVPNNEEMVESSNNMAIAEIVNDKFRVTLSVRSSNDKQKQVILDKIQEVSKIFSASVKYSDGYPMWQPNFESKLAELAKSAYAAVSEKELEVKTIHAGLETGLLSEKYPDMDMISIGPDIIGAHTPLERLSIGSTERTRDFLKEILARI